jgi:hypothetical protein
MELNRIGCTRAINVAAPTALLSELTGENLRQECDVNSHIANRAAKLRRSGMFHLEFISTRIPRDNTARPSRRFEDSVR